MCEIFLNNEKIGICLVEEIKLNMIKSFQDVPDLDTIYILSGSMLSKCFFIQDLLKIKLEEEKNKLEEEKIQKYIDKIIASYDKEIKEIKSSGNHRIKIQYFKSEQQKFFNDKVKNNFKHNYRIYKHM